MPPYIHRFIDRHGTERVYYRRRGYPRVALPGPIGSPAFWQAYRTAEASPEKTPQQPAHDAPGSMSALITAYYRSAEWRALASSSRETYRRQLEHFRLAHGHKRVAHLQTEHVNRLLDKVAGTPAAANNLRDRLNVLMAYAVATGLRSDNPVTAAKRIRHKIRGWRPWTEADITAFRKRWPLGTAQRIAMEILLHTGLRRSDAVRLGPQHIIGGTTFVISTVKSQGRTELAIPIHPSLRPILASGPADQLLYIGDRSRQGSLG
jgi:integrase